MADVAKKYVMNAVVKMMTEGDVSPVDVLVTSGKNKETVSISPDMVIECMKHEIALLEKKSAKKADKKLSADTLARMDKVEQAMIDLFDGEVELTDGGVTPTQIIKAGVFEVGTTPQQIRSALVLLSTEGRVVEVKRKPKSSTWRLPSDEE